MNYQRLAVINRYYKITRFYEFLKELAIKGGLTILAVVAILVALELFVLDFNTLLNSMVEHLPTLMVFAVFLVSETILGLIPPEIFIAWGSKTLNPWVSLAILSGISYLGGIFAYFIGKLFFRIEKVKQYIEVKVAIHIRNLRKWGGLLVFVGAMLPIPHSVVSLACGLIHYNFKHYLMWALFRFVRFALYGAVLFKIF